MNSLGESKLKLMIVMIAFLFNEKGIVAQPALEWQYQTPGLSNNVASGIAVDGSGNTYLGSVFSGTTDIDPDSAVTPLQAEKSESMLVCKYNANGNLLWTKIVTKAFFNSLAVDSTGNIYLTGFFNKTVDFDPGPGVYNLTQSLGTPSNIFFCKWDSSGNLLWAKSESSASYINPYNYNNIHIDNSGFIYVLGTSPPTFNYFDACIFKLDTAGNLIWAKQTLSISGNCQPRKLTIDNSGNLIFTGFFYSITDFDPGPGIFNLNYTTGNIYLCKWDSGGNFIWARNFAAGPGTLSNKYPVDLAVDSINNIIVAGNIVDTADLDPDTAVFNLIGNNNSFTGFIAKYSSASGSLIWAKLSVRISKFFCENGDNLVCLGTFQNNSDFDPGPNSYIMTTSGSALFYLKLDYNGEFLSAKKLASIAMTNTNLLNLNSIANDFKGRFYITGRFFGTIDFNSSNGISHNASEKVHNLYISKFSRTGNYIWTNVLKGSLLKLKLSDVDENGNIYSAGIFTGMPDFDDGPGYFFLPFTSKEKIFLSKINSAGQLIWVKLIGNENTNLGRSVKVDNLGNIYLIGTFTGSVDFDPGPGVFNLASLSNMPSFFILKLNGNGEFVWVKTIDPLNPNNSFQEIHRMAIDGAGNIFVAGNFRDSIQYNSGISTHILHNSNSQEYFYILKLNSQGYYLWSHTFGDSDDYSEVYELCTDAAGNIYISGIAAPYTDWDPDPNNVQMISNCSPPSHFILKLSSSGNYIWVKSFQCFSNLASDGVLLDNLFASANGNFYVSGQFIGTIDFNPGPGLDTISSDNTVTFDDFLVKLDSSGNFVFAKKFNQSNGRFLSFALHNEHILLYNNGVLYELDSIGNLIWYNLFYCYITINNYHSYIYNYSVPIYIKNDKNDNLYLTGAYKNSCDLGINLINNVYSSGLVDVYTAKYHYTPILCSTPPTGIMSTAINNLICSGQSIGLTRVGGALSSSGDFYWFTDSCGGTLIGTGQSIVVNPTNTTTYYLRTEDSCGVSSCVSISIQTIPSPLPPVISNNMPFCKGDSITISSNTGYASYLWSNGSTQPTTIVSHSGIYALTVTSANGCSASTEFTVANLPDPVTNITPSVPVSICLGDTVHFSVFYGMGYSFQWFRNSLPVPGAIFSYFDANLDGVYSCFVTDSNNCSVFSDLVKVKIVCYPPSDDALKIHPENSANPYTFIFYQVNTQELLISGKNFKDGSCQIKLFNSLAQEIILDETNVVSGAFSHSINCGLLPKGLYFVLVANDRELFSKKLIID